MNTRASGRLLCLRRLSMNRNPTPARMGRNPRLRGHGLGCTIKAAITEILRPIPSTTSRERIRVILPSRSRCSDRDGRITGPLSGHSGGHSKRLCPISQVLPHSQNREAPALPEDNRRGSLTRSRPGEDFWSLLREVSAYGGPGEGALSENLRPTGSSLRKGGPTRLAVVLHDLVSPGLCCVCGFISFIFVVCVSQPTVCGAR